MIVTPTLTIALILALGLLAYLAYALLQPEKFQ
ncbi:MAG: K(+)-transporting ATPase subunit F [Acidobacteriota bacterium]|nr:K(+)-transporting ATPase subunit F [Acidobacteriota bacterium]